MLVALLAANALVLLLSCVGMMVVFLGGEGYLPALLLLLLLSLPFSTLCILAGHAWFLHRFGWRDALPAIWRAVPRWQMVALALVVALISCGALALYITLLLDDSPPRFWQYLPLFAGILSAVAYCTVEAARETRSA